MEAVTTVKSEVADIHMADREKEAVAYNKEAATGDSGHKSRKSPAENIIEAYRRGEKDAALARRGSINDKASAIGILLMKVQDELKKRLG